MRIVPRERHTGHSSHAFVVRRLARSRRTRQIASRIPQVDRTVLASATDRVSIGSVGAHGNLCPCPSFARFDDDDGFVCHAIRGIPDTERRVIG